MPTPAIPPKITHPTAPLAEITAWDYQPRTRLVSGTHCVERVGELARELGARKILLVTDAGIVAAGHAERVRKLLAAQTLSVVVYADVRENPTTDDVARCLALAKNEKVNFFIGLGGGSAMDTAKGGNFILTNGGVMQDYWGVGKAKKPMLPMIAIPTTAGTGSECQSAALITDKVTHQKMACLDPKAAARVAILDPALTLSQPLRVTACTGIDAIAHAVETAVTKKRNPLSLMFSREAFRLCAEAFPQIMQSPSDLTARAQMQLGAAFAGTAIENSMLGAAHSAANPLTAHYGVVHGQAVGLMLPHIVRFNAREKSAAENYKVLFGPATALATFLEKLLKECGLASPLSDLGVKRSQIPTLAAEASKQWTAAFNPRPITQNDFVKIYGAAF